jgi:hypothetical protein
MQPRTAALVVSYRLLLSCCSYLVYLAGILGPVVLLAALGPDYAPLGMLATVALYFQQLPSAQVLFHLHKEQVAAAAAAAAAGSIPALPGHERQQRCGWQEQQPLLAAAEAGCISSSLCSGADSNSSSSSGAYSSRGGNTAVARQAVEGYVNGSQHALVKPAAASMSELTAADTAAAAAEGRELGFTRQQQHLQRHCGSAESLQQLHHRHTQHEYVLHVASTLKQQQHHQEHSCSFNQEHQSTASLITSLCLKVCVRPVPVHMKCLGRSSCASVETSCFEASTLKQQQQQQQQQGHSCFKKLNGVGCACSATPGTVAVC